MQQQRQKEEAEWDGIRKYVELCFLVVVGWRIEIHR